jgi:haloalkane dehalogenase
MLRRFDPLKKRRQEVLGVPMAYVEHGRGRPIVLLHGNPTSSFLWRKVIPALSSVGRCIAPDLIGMGDSAKVFRGPRTYTFLDHQAYLEAFLASLEIEDEVTLVGHDWGGPLLFDWGRRHDVSVRAVAYMETIVTPLTWDDWPEAARRMFEGLRSEAGEEMVLEKNLFVERLLPASVLDPLPDAVLDVYRRPYLEVGESRRPTLTWPREIPLDGQPANVSSVVADNETWLEGPEVPKLFINADPGSILVGRQREVCRRWANQTEITVRGLHFVQEDSGEQIGEAIAAWLDSL